MQQAAVNLPSTVSVGNKTVRIQQRLGNGAFGVVYKVKDEASSMVYALKDVLCLNDSALRNAVREAKTLKKISHTDVIAIMGADQVRDKKGLLHMLLLTEYCSGGSLNDRLARPSTEEMNVKWISQTARALAHLHSRGVVHRDLKADNVLLTAAEDVKLADFGLAREYTALKGTNAQQDEGSLTSNTQYYMSSGTGPVHWVAPEFFTGRYKEKNRRIFPWYAVFRHPRAGFHRNWWKAFVRCLRRNSLCRKGWPWVCHGPGWSSCPNCVLKRCTRILRSEKCRSKGLAVRPT